MQPDSYATMITDNQDFIVMTQAISNCIRE